MTHGLPEQPFRFPRPEPMSEADKRDREAVWAASPFPLPPSSQMPPPPLPPAPPPDWDQEYEDSDPAWRLLGLCLVGAFVIGFWATLAWLILR